MSDSERTKALRDLTMLYNPGDFSAARSSMPTYMEDESGEEFSKFFDFLQALYLFRTEFPTMEEEDITRAAITLENLANQYDYPTNQIEVFK